MLYLGCDLIVTKSDGPLDTYMVPFFARLSVTVACIYGVICIPRFPGASTCGEMRPETSKKRPRTLLSDTYIATPKPGATRRALFRFSDVIRYGSIGATFAQERGSSHT